MSLITKETFTNGLTEKILIRYGNSVSRVGGTGSFFYEDMSRNYSLKGDRTVDIHLIINNPDKFYSNFDPTEFSLDRRINVEKLLVINKHIPSYFLSSDESYRITVTPLDKFEEWTSNDSKIGYFLSGRYQKPMTVLFQNSSDKNQIDNQLQNIYDLGVNLTLENFSVDKDTNMEDLIANLYLLSYISEGPRSAEAKKKNKHYGILKALESESYEIYEKRFVKSLERRVLDENMNIEQNMKDFKNWAFPRFAFMVSLLSQTNSNPEEFAKKKIIRTWGYNENDKILQAAMTPVVFGLIKYKEFMMRNLPREQKEIIMEINKMKSIN